MAQIYSTVRASLLFISKITTFTILTTISVFQHPPSNTIATTYCTQEIIVMRGFYLFLHLVCACVGKYLTKFNLDNIRDVFMCKNDSKTLKMYLWRTKHWITHVSVPSVVQQLCKVSDFRKSSISFEIYDIWDILYLSTQLKTFKHLTLSHTQCPSEINLVLHLIF